jgi:pyruvate dehydrogenase (quinone)
MHPLLSTPSDTRICGVVGDSVKPVVDVLRLNGKAKWIHVRHKETIAFAAGAEAQLSRISQSAAAVAAPATLT